MGWYRPGVEKEWNRELEPAVLTAVLTEYGQPADAETVDEIGDVASSIREVETAGKFYIAAAGLRSALRLVLKVEGRPADRIVRAYRAQLKEWLSRQADSK